VLLVAGAEALVRGASKSAVALGISPLVIGLTVVAFGTSAPEMAVSVMSGYAGQGDIALGQRGGQQYFQCVDNFRAVRRNSAAYGFPSVDPPGDLPLMVAVSLILLVMMRRGT
jgi:cation:H+ antiporter